MVALPPDAGRTLAEGIEKVLSTADRLIASASEARSPETRDRLLQIGRSLFEEARGLMAALPADPRGLAPGFQRVLEMGDDIARLAESEDNPALRSLLVAQARDLMEVGRRYAPAIKIAAEMEKAAWARMIPE